MKYNLTYWYSSHVNKQPILNYSGTARNFVPLFPVENKPKFIPDPLLNSKHLTQH